MLTVVEVIEIGGLDIIGQKLFPRFLTCAEELTHKHKTRLAAGRSRPPTLREFPIPWSNFAYGNVPNSTWAVFSEISKEPSTMKMDVCFRPGLHNSFLYF